MMPENLEKILIQIYASNPNEIHNIVDMIDILPCPYFKKVEDPLKLTKILIESGKYNITMKNRYNRDILSDAINSNHMDVAFYLLAIPGLIVFSMMERAIRECCVKNNYDLFIKLMNHESLIGEEDFLKERLLYYAISNDKNIDIVKYVLDIPNINYTFENKVPLISCCRNNSFELMRLLLNEPGIDPNVKENEEDCYEALFYSSIDDSNQINRFECLKLLYFDKRIKYNEIHVLKEAIGSNSVDCVEFILAKYSSFDETSDYIHEIFYMLPSKMQSILNKYFTIEIYD